MEIGLVNDKPNALGEDTWWTWMMKTFKHRWFNKNEMASGVPLAIQNGLWGPTPMAPGITRIIYCIDTFTEINRLWPNSYDWGVYPTIEALNRSQVGVTHHLHLMSQYEDLGAKPGKWKIISLGVNTDLWKEFSRQEKAVMREKYGIPLDANVGFWCGAASVFFKGWDRFPGIVKENPDVYWLIVFKPGQASPLPPGFKGKTWNGTDQQTMAELMNASNFFISLNPLQCWFLVEIEAMACNLPIVLLPGQEKEWYPDRAWPRDDVFKHRWDRGSAKKDWSNLFQEMGLEDFLA